MIHRNQILIGGIFVAALGAALMGVTNECHSQNNFKEAKQLSEIKSIGQNLLLPEQFDLTTEDKITLSHRDAPPQNVPVLKEYKRGKFVYGGYNPMRSKGYPVFLQMFRFESSTSTKSTFMEISKESDKLDDGRTTDGSVFDPQFSPDGRYILFKFGIVFSPGTYRIYVYDLKTHLTRLVINDFLQYYAVSWSPDSQYIAVAKGGDISPQLYDFGHTYEQPLQLCVIEWKTGKTYPVTTDGTLRGPWEWIAPHTLVYGALSKADQKFLTDPGYEKGIDFVEGEPIGWERLSGTPKRIPVRPSLYTYSPKDQMPKLLLHDGYLPSASPDGKHIAFFGSANAEKAFPLQNHWEDSPSGAFLNILSIDPLEGSFNVKDRIPLQQYYKKYPQVVWLRDNRHLLILHEKDVTEESHSLDIEEWDIEKRTNRIITTIQSNGEDKGRSASDPIFRSPIISPDGTRLMIIVDEYYKDTKEGGYYNKETLKEIDLKNRSVHEIMTVKPAFGSSWSYDILY